MYCLVFQMFNRVWDEMNADYMDFMNVASSVKELTLQALDQAEDLTGFARALGVKDYKPNTTTMAARESSLLDMKEVESHCQKMTKRNNRQSLSGSRGAMSVSTLQSRHKSNSQSAGSVNSTVSAESMALASENVNLDIFVQIANQSTHVTIPRSVMVKEAIELTMKGLKKKVSKKAKKIEPQHLFNKTTGIWLEDNRAVWTYLLKDNEKLELKSKSSAANNRKVDVQLKLESGTSTQTVEFLAETSVRGVIQSLVLKQKGGWLPDKPVVDMLGINLSNITFRSTTPASTAPNSFSNWSVGEVCDWLKELGMEEEVVGCFEKGGVDGKGLGNVTAGSLRELGVVPLGTRKEIVRQMTKIK